MVRKKEKICSRGHKFNISGACPICWPGRLKKKVGGKVYKKTLIK